MRAIKDLPTAFDRFWEIGGVLRFATFEDAEGSEQEFLTSVSAIVPDIDGSALSALGFRRIDDRTFLGDWYDPENNALVRRGVFRSNDGLELVDPKLRDLCETKIVSGGWYVPDTGEGGQFAYAFSSPPYPLLARPSEIEHLFLAVRNFILPPNCTHEISDWSSPRLPETSTYFDAGAEWWGVFLFTIYIPGLRRLTAIAGSASD